MPNSWKPAVKVAGNGDKWAYNALCFATEKEAADNASDLMGRWFAVTDCAAHPSDDMPTHSYVNHKLEPLA